MHYGAILKDKLSKRHLVSGMKLDFPSADITEFLSELGLDYLFIDCENASADFQTVVAMIRAAHSGGIPVILRPWSSEPGLVRRYLDCGVDGIMAPDISTGAEAEILYRAIADTIPSKLDRFIFAPVVESEQAVNEIDSILAIPGVDVVVVGPADLAVSLGEPRKGANLKTHDAVFRVLNRARECGRSACLPATRYGAEESWNGGANMLILSLKDACRIGVRQQLKTLEPFNNQ